MCENWKGVEDSVLVLHSLGLFTGLYKVPLLVQCWGCLGRDEILLCMYLFICNGNKTILLTGITTTYD